MSNSQLDIMTLARLARQSTNDVRHEAIKDGTLLPVWRDGHVCLVDASTNEVVREVFPGDELEELKAHFAKEGLEIETVAAPALMVGG